MHIESPSLRESNLPRDARATRRARIRKALYIAPALLLILGGVIFFGLRWFEYVATFHPAPYVPGASWRLPQGSEDVGFTTADGVRLHGWFIQARTKPAAATIIYFHGNGGNVSHIGWIGEHLAACGFDVMLFDYRGYGRSEGKATDERGLYADADAAYDYVVRERGAIPEKLVLYGQSLGTTAVVELASRRACRAIVLESGLSSASDLASSLLPWMPRWLHKLGKNRFESARKLADVHCPVLVTHGEPDNRIPTEQGRVLYASANEPKRLLIVPGAGHNVVGSGGIRYLDTVSAFIRESLKRDK